MDTVSGPIVTGMSLGLADSAFMPGPRFNYRKDVRAAKREAKHASWPHCGARQSARIARQVAAGRLKAENGLAT